MNYINKRLRIIVHVLNKISILANYHLCLMWYSGARCTASRIGIFSKSCLLEVFPNIKSWYLVPNFDIWKDFNKSQYSVEVRGTSIDELYARDIGNKKSNLVICDLVVAFTWTCGGIIHCKLVPPRLREVTEWAGPHCQIDFFEITYPNLVEVLSNIKNLTLSAKFWYLEEQL